MQILSVVGARPQFVKLGAIAAAVRHHPEVEHVIVHTGQHYDPGLSDAFFDDLGIPAPDINLGVGSGGHAEQTAAILAGLGPVIEQVRPDWVLVYGDTNSTLAASVAAVKLHVPLAHLEAGLRSFNRRMPEEHNRVLTDHAADLLLAPTALAAENLAHEGLAARTVVVGDVMTDICLVTAEAVRDRAPSVPPGVADGPYVLATIHRADNTDDPERLGAILAALAACPIPVVLAAHPRLVDKAAAAGLTLAGGAVTVVAPLAYPDLVATVMRARTVLTDSGGLQKEAYLLGAPCTTLRTETEWVETLADGWNVLDPGLTRISGLVVRDAPSVPRGHPYGDGHAAEAVVRALKDAMRPEGS